ncbi:MAG: glycosyltransferase family 4 protein [Thermoanaerobaculia bacterium]
MPASSQQIESRPRLLFVGNFLSGEGQVPQLCEELANRIELEGWSVLRTSSKAGKVARLAEMVVTAFGRRGDFDLVQIDLFSGSAFVWAEIVALALQANQRPFVLTLHGGLLPEFSARYPGRVRRLLRSAAVVTSPSAFLAERMREFRSDIEVLPNPLDLTRFEFHPRDDPRPKLVWLRAFHEVYRPWLAVEVLGHLAAAYPGARLTMYGPDKADGSKEKTEAAIRRLGLEKRVSVGGAIPAEEVPSSLQDGDVFLNTSKVDNAPRSVVEAMACGLCVTSTDVGGVACFLDDGKDALLVSPDDPEAMANAVVRILSDSKLAESLSRNGRR